MNSSSREADIWASGSWEIGLLSRTQSTQVRSRCSLLPSLTSGTDSGDGLGAPATPDSGFFHLTSSRRLQNYSLHSTHSHVMFSIHAARHCHSFTLLRRSLTTLRAPAIRHASLKTLARPQSIVRHFQPAVQRHASSQSLVARTATSSLNRSKSKVPFRGLQSIR